MKIQTKIQKWGNGLAIRVTGIMRDMPRFKEGTPVEVAVFEDKLEIRKIQAIKRLGLPYSEKDLLKGMNPKNAHAELISKLLKNEY